MWLVLSSRVTAQLQTTVPPTKLQRFIKPTQQRQTAKKEAIYNRARRERERVIEAALADPALAPF